MKVSMSVLAPLFAFVPNTRRAAILMKRHQGQERRGPSGPQRRLGSLSSTARFSVDCVSLLNAQVTRELEASQLYLSACIWCDAQNLEGMANYMLEESKAERGHGLNIVAFARKRNIPLALTPLPAPRRDWETPLELWTDLFEAEQSNSQSLYRLADAAAECHDHALTAFLMPYHQEQVESEAHLDRILSKVQDESRTPGMLRQLDTELGARVHQASIGRGKQYTR